jgi:hypothetical protein
MPVAEVIDAGSKGLGIQAGQFIKQGDFVGEYMGEIVTEQEYHLRRLVCGPPSRTCQHPARLMV